MAYGRHFGSVWSSDRCANHVPAAMDGATVNCYAENFWGEKNNGFAVMYQIMKGGQHSVKELCDFLKERAGFEDDYQRNGIKAVKLLNNFDGNTALNPVWQSLKAYYQKLLEVQQSFVTRLLELSKEVNRFGEEQFKQHKSVKEKESKTFEAVNLIQTTTTCLQKAKETYQLRWTELENVKREHCSAKELSKLENRMKKAREEYRNYVVTYEKVRVDFENRMVAAATNFHGLQFNYLEQMKQFILSYVCGVSKYYQTLMTLSEELNSEILGMDVAKLLAELVNSRKTGSERPVPMQFEELQATDSVAAAPVSSVFDVNFPQAECTGSSGQSSADQQSGLRAAALSGAAPVSSLSQSKTKLNLWLPGLLSSSKSSSSAASASRDADSAERKSLPGVAGKISDGGSSLSNDKAQQIESNAAWTNPLFDGSFNSPCANSDTAGSGTTDSDVDPSRKRTLSIGFLKKISKERKKPSINHCSEASPVKTMEPTSSFDWSSRKIEDSTKDSSDSFSSSSDDDSDDLAFKKINVDIKPNCRDRINVSASVDELREAVGSMAVTRSVQGSWMYDSSQDNRMTTMKPNMVLRPARTGDDKWNNLSFAGAEQRLRPRSATPTHMISLEMPSQRKLSKSNQSCRDGVSENLVQSRGPSPFGEQNAGSIPLATAIIETVHALFKPSDECIVKVFGSVTLSFPSGCVGLLRKDANAYPLSFGLKNYGNIHSVVYNQKLMRRLASDDHKYHFEMGSLFNQLKENVEREPQAPYFNLEVMRYEVKSGPFGNGTDKKEMAPLLVESSWNRCNEDVEICIRYRYNPYCRFFAPLLNVTFVTDITGHVQHVQCSPFITWSHEANHLQWKLTELSCHGRSSGVLRATVRFDNCEAVPAPTLVQFQATDSCLSNVELELLNNYYRLSLARKRLISGKYICEPRVSL